ncbi:IcmB protein [Gluconacetobacter sacchari DSM 12717]|uniref:Type IV secretion protein DotO n=2 Tax=Gluconacetobacter sacchari TaxID=92759 RepID=A0A7W4NPE5_9PROT|nr:type IV secretion protein DotO [Gluconacetobacter sacchari]MBB2161594.1 type IV secretion protein DotO [Gluconacetobacter sacchari]GBQ21479.1 IcmB protein [Gluconacetobacter sacchari DSM 12717]
MRGIGKGSVQQAQETVRRFMKSASPLDGILRALSRFSLTLKGPITSFCNLATSDGEALVGFDGSYMTLVRVHGIRRMINLAETEAAGRDLRSQLSASFQSKAHALDFCYISDPGSTTDAITRCIEDARKIALRIGLDFTDIFAEWQRYLPRFLRHEEVWLAVWTKPSALDSHETARAKAGQDAARKALPPLGDGQNPSLLSRDLAILHAAFVEQVLATFDANDVDATPLGPKDALKAIRTVIYPETRQDGWRPSLPPDDPPVTIPDERPETVDWALWPPLREQLFMEEATTSGVSAVSLGTRSWRSLDLVLAPERALPFQELVSALNTRDVPWRAGMLIEGTDQSFMAVKSAAVQWVRFGANLARADAFSGLDALRKARTDEIVRVRTTFATYAPNGDRLLLDTRLSQLRQGLSSWGASKVSPMAGDPVAGVLSNVAGLDTASTAPSHAVPLSHALTMAPWARPGLPWTSGSMLFRTPDGTLVPVDPGASGRPATLDLFIAKSRSGKSVLSNRLLLGLILSAASSTGDGYRLPLIGKLDFGETVAGLIDVVREGLPAHQKHLAAYCRMELAPGYELNIFDVLPGCRKPTQGHRVFLENFLNLWCVDENGQSYERMSMLINAVIDVVYDMVSDEGIGTYKKGYRRGVEREVDNALDRYGVDVDRDTTWYEVTDLLCDREEWRIAGFASRQAVPTFGDLLQAASDKRILDAFGENDPRGTGESLPRVFASYIAFFRSRFPTLCTATTLDLSDARVIGVDVERICPKGSGQAQRQTEMMWLLGFHMVSRKHLTDPADADAMPARVRDYHRRCFVEFNETYKRLEADEYHLTNQSDFVGAMMEFIARFSARYRLSLALTSQEFGDFGQYLVDNATGIYILSGATEDNINAMQAKFGLSGASVSVIRHGLNGPAPDGSGSPFIMKMRVHDKWYEHLLVNTMGPIEMWALSTNPQDRALRSRLYARLGPSEARRRLARVFAKGTAVPAIEARMLALRSTGTDEEQAAAAVEVIAQEIGDGVGLGAVIREENA